MEFCINVLLRNRSGRRIDTELALSAETVLRGLISTILGVGDFSEALPLDWGATPSVDCSWGPALGRRALLTSYCIIDRFISINGPSFRMFA